MGRCHGSWTSGARVCRAGSRVVLGVRLCRWVGEVTCRRSARCSPASGESTLASSELAGSVAGRSNGMGSARPASPTTGEVSLAGATSVLWTSEELSRSTSSAAGFPASPFRSRGSSGRVQTNDGYGPSSRVPFAKFDPASSSWRTSATSWLSTMEDRSERFSGTWPRSGMTRSGIVYRLRPSAPLTNGTDSSSWPTPTATPYGYNQSPSPGAAVRPSLEGMAKRWPTPNAWDPLGSRTLPEGTSVTGMTPDGRKKQVGLANAVDMVTRRWPTMTAGDAKSSGTAGYPTSERHHSGVTLADAVERNLWRTLTATEEDGGGQDPDRTSQSGASVRHRSTSVSGPSRSLSVALTGNHLRAVLRAVSAPAERVSG